jgi:2-polyprenyl-3-methyl-5-hydroxy-6-metoxy-1,4-benzoquinol methylase
VCNLIFVDEKHLITAKDEKTRYEAHENGIEQAGYVDFLNRALQPGLKYLKPGMEGLDFGCGPAPTLSILLERENIKCLDYDPFFFPEIPKCKFDFIYATECFEHFYEPKKEIETIASMLKPGGYLIIMTCLWKSFENFPTWHYTNDITHVVFYNEHTMNYITEKYGLNKIEIINERIVILQKI